MVFHVIVPCKVFQFLGNFAHAGHGSKEEPSASVGRGGAGPQTPQGGEQGGEQAVGSARKEPAEAQGPPSGGLSALCVQLASGDCAQGSSSTKSRRFGFVASLAARLEECDSCLDVELC